MVWGKGSIHSSDDGAGHVAIVEEVIDGNTVYTSESGYKSFYFANMTRNNNNGNWGLSSPYWFRGFIVNPAVKWEPVLMDIRNWDLYYWCYEDLQREIGYNGPGLERHWIDWGANEGRIYSYVFDAEYYANKYSDIKEAFGNDYKAMYNHFIQYGIDEGRAGNICLDLTYYRENNPDLQAMTNKELVNHFIQFGINEINRPCSPEFSVKAYRNKNPDLAKAFGYKSAKLYKHWWMYGRFENRKHNWGTPKK